jgi:tetratricopeptide (TPR) repeat protein
MSEAAADRKLTAESLLKLGQLLRITSKYQEALENLKRSEQISLDLGDEQGAVMAVGAMGGIHGEQANYHEAISCFERKRDWCLAHGMVAELEEAWGNLGVIYAEQKQYSRALECYEVQVDIAERLGDRQGLSLAQGNIGNIHLHQGDYEQAVKFYNKQIAMATAIGDIRSLSAVSCNLGLLCKRQGRLDEAVINFQKAISSGRRIGYARVYSLSTGNLGSVYLFMGRWDEARCALDDFLEMSEQVGDASCIVIARANLSLLERFSGNLGKAREYMAIAVSVVEEHKLDNFGPAVYNMAAEQSLESGDFDEAASFAGRAAETAKRTEDAEQSAKAATLSVAIRSARGDMVALKELEACLDNPYKEVAFLACGYCYLYGKSHVHLDRLAKLGNELYQKTGNIQFKLDLERWSKTSEPVTR